VIAREARPRTPAAARTVMIMVALVSEARAPSAQK
jgi:hypothetical protein